MIEREKMMSNDDEAYQYRMHYPKKKRKIWPWVLGALVVLGLVCGLGMAAVSGDAEPPKAAASAPVPSASPSKAVPPANKVTPKPIPKPQTIGEGQWEVGTDVKPGKYKTKGADDGIIVLCSWTVQKGEQFVDSGVVDKTTAQGVVTLKKGQTFETQGCQDWTLQTSVNLEWKNVSASSSLKSKKVYVISQGLSGWPVSSAVNWIDGYTGSDWVNAKSCPRGAYRCIWVQKNNGLKAPVIAATYHHKTSRVLIQVDVAYANSRGITSQAKRKYVIAHELGHAGWLTGHSGSKSNLMYSHVGGYKYGLTSAQKNTLRSH